LQTKQDFKMEDRLTIVFRFVTNRMIILIHQNASVQFQKKKYLPTPCKMKKHMMH
jgi:hypothetical protein